MIIRQEETTPIGDYFHDSGVWQIFNQLSNVVDDFEVNTDELNLWIDNIVSSLKGLKGHIKKCETEWTKMLNQQKLNDLIKRGE